MDMPVVFIRTTGQSGDLAFYNPADITAVHPASLTDYSTGGDKKTQVNGARLRVRGEVDELWVLEPAIEIMSMIGQARRVQRDSMDPNVIAVPGYERQPWVMRDMGWIRNIRKGVDVLNQDIDPAWDKPYTYDEVQSALITVSAKVSGSRNPNFNRPIKQVIDERRTRHETNAVEREGPMLERLMNPTQSLPVGDNA